MIYANYYWTVILQMIVNTVNGILVIFFYIVTVIFKRIMLIVFSNKINNLSGTSIVIKSHIIHYVFATSKTIPRILILHKIFIFHKIDIIKRNIFP